MPVTEAEHFERIQRQREYRDTSPVPEDERIALPGPMRFGNLAEDVVVSTCPRCGQDCVSAAVEVACRCGAIHQRMWPGL